MERYVSSVSEWLLSIYSRLNMNVKEREREREYVGADGMICWTTSFVLT